MKRNLEQQRQLFIILTNLPRGRICLKSSALKPKAENEASSEIENGDNYWQLY